jgi:hypothetical protein
MLLRNGKVLKPAKPSNVKDEMNIIKELKIFFRSLFYYYLTNIGNRLRIDEIERTKGRKATLDELIEWQPNQTFWQEYLKKAQFRMMVDLPVPALMKAFDCFVKQEHNLHGEEVEIPRIKHFVRNYLYYLYNHNNSWKMMNIMEEQKEGLSENHPKRVYLQALASQLASEAAHPMYNNRPYARTWETFLQESRARTFYVPDVEGGRTVVRSRWGSCNFAMGSVPSYKFIVLETCEAFNSPEKNIRKAFLLHRKANSC